MRAAKVTHQGPTVGYRIEEHGHAFVYLPDHEPSIGNDLDRFPRLDERLRPPAMPTCCCTTRITTTSTGPTWVGSLQHHRLDGFATKAGVGHVVLFHHDPYHDDDDLETLLAEARALWSGPADDVQLASERMTITFDESGVAVGDAA